MQQLSTTSEHRLGRKLNLLTSTGTTKIVAAFHNAKKRLILLDYDGVLSELIPDPAPAASAPTPELLATLKKLCGMPNTNIVILSGRPRAALESWFGDLPATLGAEHGAWVREKGKWAMRYDIDESWKQPILPVLESTTRLTPGSALEQKQFSLVWHYRNVDTALAHDHKNTLRSTLGRLTANSEIGVYEGHKIIEIKPKTIRKSVVASQKFAEAPYDFVMAAGDDYNDEDMFAALPASAITIKVGLTATVAKYHIESVARVKSLLAHLAAGTTSL